MKAFFLPRLSFERVWQLRIPVLTTLPCGCPRRWWMSPFLFIGDGGNRSGRLIFTPALHACPNPGRRLICVRSRERLHLGKRQPYNQADRSFQHSIQDTAGDETWSQASQEAWAVSCTAKAGFFMTCKPLVTLLPQPILA
jgi:hypothetical protein